VLVRKYQDERHTVTVVPGGYVWREATYANLSTIARAITGTAWSGPRFFGLRAGVNRREDIEGQGNGPHAGGAGAGRSRRSGGSVSPLPGRVQRCNSTEHNLDLEFNSLDAQREGTLSRCGASSTVSSASAATAQSPMPHHRSALAAGYASQVAVIGLPREEPSG